MSSSNGPDVDPRAEYMRRAHAMQSGVAMLMNYDGGPVSGETSPKHLRVGVNAALVDASALAQLLIRKGVITEAEYHEALAAGMEAEADQYAGKISRIVGRKVDLR